jgi:acylphosphatase
MTDNLRMEACLKFRIEGRVQGVWFRESTRRQAERLGLSGYAINKADGSVEVLARGATDDLARLQDWLRQGPPLAEVRAVKAEECDQDCPPGFTTG